VAAEENFGIVCSSNKAFRSADFLKCKILLEQKEHRDINKIGNTNPIIPCFETLNQKKEKEEHQTQPSHKATNL